MSKTTQTTRRSFLKTGAIVAVPVAAVVTPAAVMAADDTGLRLARLEAERAIEALNRDFLREFNRAGAGGTARLFADGKAPELGDHTARLLVDPTVAPDLLELSGDGSTAHYRIACTVESEHPVEGEETIARMARLQGNGVANARREGGLVADYVRLKEGWAIRAVRLV